MKVAMNLVRASIVAAAIIVAFGCGGDDGESKPGSRTASVAPGTLPTAGTSPLGAAGRAGTSALPPPTISVPPQQPQQPVPPTTPAPSVPPASSTPPRGTTPPAGMPPAGVPPAGMPPAAVPPAGMPPATAMPAPSGSKEPIIPELPGECPQFRSGTITYMGLGGIQLQAGAKAAGPTAPMVFYWHGTGSVAGEYAGSAGAVHQGVLQEGGVLISFQGTTGGDFLSGTAIFGAGDFKLADGLLACAVKNHNIDPRRVYATGCSAGGLFSTAMAAMRSNYLAAAAPNSGGSQGLLQWQGMYTPALMTVHGAPGVDVVGIDFSQSSKTADTAFKARGGFVINCNHGGGHCGGGGLAPDIWKFFKAHPYGVDPKPWTSGLPAGFNSKCKIF